MKENLVSLAKLLATDDAFNLAFSSRGTDEEKYELAKTKFTDFAREDFLEFLKNLREAEENNLANLSPDELEMVAGGAGGWGTKLAAATMLVTTLGAAGVMSQQADAMKGRHAGSSSEQTPPQSVTTTRQMPLAKHFGRHDLTKITLAKPRQQLDIKGKNLEEILKQVAIENESSATERLQDHHEKNVGTGSSSLIGELAQIVESFIRIRKEPLSRSGITFFGAFQDPEKDIIAENCGSYDTLIKNMINVHSATIENAAKILENLSKPCRPPKDSHPSNEFNLEDFEEAERSSNFVTNLFNALFEDLNDESKAFVAVLLCECIRFNDDGAIVRYGIKKTLNECMQEESHIAFENQFTYEHDIPSLLFTRREGKQEMIDQFYDMPRADVSRRFGKEGTQVAFERNKKEMNETKHFISLIELPQDQTTQMGAINENQMVLQGLSLQQKQEKDMSEEK